MTSNYLSQISRLNGELAGLDRDAAAVGKKELEVIRKINKAQDAANKATSISSAKSKLRELEQARKSLVDTKKKQSDIAAKRAQKSNSLLDYQKRQARADEMARKKVESDQRKLMQDREAYQQLMALETRSQSRVIPTGTTLIEWAKKYDFFICHASEDKDDFVRELAELLSAKGAKVWYDEFTMTVGKRLRREIDRGLVNSRFGIVVVSDHFFAKEWPQRELDGLLSLDNQEESCILPIWHKVTKDEVTRHSPTLADIIALNTGVQSTEDIVDKLLSIIGPAIAREKTST